MCHNRRGDQLSILLDLDGQDFFVQTVADRFKKVSEELLPLIECDTSLDEDGLKFAHAQYVQNIRDFAVNLNSENPDHYKRSGALLHALYKSDYIAEPPSFTPDEEEIEGGFTRINYHDGVHTISVMQFFLEYHKEVVTFDLTYDACASYEDNPATYDFDYLYNMSRYLKSNTALCLDTFFMIMKSLMRG